MGDLAQPLVLELQRGDHGDVIAATLNGEPTTIPAALSIAEAGIRALSKELSEAQARAERAEGEVERLRQAITAAGEKLHPRDGSLPTLDAGDLALLSEDLHDALPQPEREDTCTCDVREPDSFGNRDLIPDPECPTCEVGPHDH